MDFLLASSSVHIIAPRLHPIPLHSPPASPWSPFLSLQCLFVITCMPPLFLSIPHISQDPLLPCHDLYGTLGTHKHVNAHKFLNLCSPYERKHDTCFPGIWLVALSYFHFLLLSWNVILSLSLALLRIPLCKFTMCSLSCLLLVDMEAGSVSRVFRVQNGYARLSLWDLPWVPWVYPWEIVPGSYVSCIFSSTRHLDCSHSAVQVTNRS